MHSDAASQGGGWWQVCGAAYGLPCAPPSCRCSTSRASLPARQATLRRPSRSRRRSRRKASVRRTRCEIHTGGSGSTMFHGCSTTHDTPRCSTSVRWTLVEHSWNTRGTLVEHSWNTSDPWGLYSSVGSAHKHSWNTRGTRQVDPDTVNPAHAWPFCGWSPVRIPIEHGFAFFQAVHRFESESCKKISKWSWVRIPVWAHF